LQDDSDEDDIPLEGLGYVEFGDEAEEGEEDGLVLSRSGAAAPGYCLLAAIPFATAVLLDSEGDEVHRWSDAGGGTWQRARLLGNGDLIVVSRPLGSLRFVLERRSWQNELLWSAPIDPHHDVRELKDGTLLVLTWELRPFPELGIAMGAGEVSETLIKDNHVTRLSAEGEVLGRFSVGEPLVAARESLELLIPDEIDPETGKGKDLFHCNSLFVMDDPELVQRDPLYTLGNVLLSSRHQNLLFVIDRANGELVWSWKDPSVEWQHEASVLPNGNILLFDNGRSERAWSRLLEVDPLKREIVWEYRAPNETDFFSQARGTVERIENGNLLVAHSEKGEIFQLNEAGEVVWRYLAPHYNEKNERGVVRVQYYERERVERYLR